MTFRRIPEQRRPRPGLPARLAIGALAAGLAFGLVGCQADNGTSHNSTAASGEQRNEAPGGAMDKDSLSRGEQPGQATGQAPAPQATGAPATAQPGQAPRDPNLQAADRSIIYTGTITVRVRDVDTAAANVLALVNGTEGFVGADERRSNDRRSEARIVLRVPASRFTATLDAVKKEGTEETRQVSTQDVTEQIVDLDARIANQKASVERVRALLARAQTIGEIVQLEAELSRREADLASLTGRKAKLDDLAALSTITVHLLGPEAKLDDAADEDGAGFVVGLKEGWSAFLASLEVLLTVLGALLPWLVALGLPLFGLVWLIRRAPRRRVAAEPAPAFAGLSRMQPVTRGTPAPTPSATAANPRPADHEPSDSRPANQRTEEQADPPGAATRPSS